MKLLNWMTVINTSFDIATMNRRGKRLTAHKVKLAMHIKSTGADIFPRENLPSAVGH